MSHSLARLVLCVTAACHGVDAYAAFRLVPPAATRAAVRMQMPIAATQLVTLIGRAPDQITFQLTMDAVAELYDVREVPFSVGDTKSEAGQNMGSAKVFSFAQISKLDKDQTLNLFGDYYRVDVLENPEGSDHANIRSFIRGTIRIQAAAPPEAACCKWLLLLGCWRGVWPLLSSVL